MRKICYLVLIIVVLTSCKKITTLPPVPHIEFRNFTIFDTIDILSNHSKGGRLKFYFEDGDGDVGLDTPEPGQPDSTNLFFSAYRKINGEKVPVTGENDPLKPSDYRIPYMEKLGRDKILKGTIAITFLYPFYTSTDTVVYEFYIKDRALNESNVVSTSEIVLSENNTYK